MNFLRHGILFIFLILLSNTSAQISDFKHIDFSKADRIAELNGGKPLDNLPLLAYNLTARLETDAEKFRAIYIWVTSNIKSDIRLSDLVSRKRIKFQNDNEAYLEWNAGWQKKAFKRLFTDRKTICTGYAYLIKELCFLSNIDVEIVNGYARTAEINVKSLDIINHSWNAVKLNNKWYLCDATWSSGYTLNGMIFIEDYNDGYFLADPILFGITHYPTDKKWFLNESLVKTEFIAPPIVYGETFERQIIPISPATMHIETTTNVLLEFSFKTTKSIFEDQIRLVFYNGSIERKFEISDLKIENDYFSFKNKFKLEGSYDVHLKIEDDIVATYTINLKKPKNEVVSNEPLH